MSEPKTGPELALLRVKRKQRKMRRDIDKMNKQAKAQEENRIEASLIGELKAAQSNNRNAKMKDTVYEAISVGRTETIENQPNARSALRLEALLPDPIQERKMRQKAQKEAKKVMNRHDQFHVNKIMTDDHWGQRNY